MPSPCLNSGYCCTVAPCPYGTWNPERHQCKELLDPDEDGRRLCALFEVIRMDPASWISPAFGAGCCSPLNTRRKEMIQQRGSN